METSLTSNSFTKKGFINSKGSESYRSTNHSQYLIKGKSPLKVIYHSEGERVLELDKVYAWKSKLKQE